MFCIAVFERNEKKREWMRKLLTKCSFSLDVEIEILWFTSDDYLNRLERYSQRIQMACISLDSPNAKAAGRRLYEENSSCLICYYANEECDIKECLNSRPISFFTNKTEEAVTEKKLEDIISDFMRENMIFNYATKKTHLAAPIRNILYFKSDLKHVVVRYCDGEQERLFGKLQDIIDLLNQLECGKLFVRIHKSYLVNSLHVLKLDKSIRMIEMFEHSRLPVSEAQYPQVLMWFEKNKCRLTR